jgi:hypothetical protein
MFDGSKAAEMGSEPTVTVDTMPGGVTAETVTLTVVGAVVAPRGEPVTWKLYEPGVTEDSTLIVKTLVAPVEVGVTGSTVKVPQLIPVGRPEQDNVTG